MNDSTRRIGIAEYNILKTENNYRERLNYIVGTEPSLVDFMSYESLDLELKIHLCKVIICRHFSSTGGVSLPRDIEWFIEGFIKEFEGDRIKPWVSSAIEESLNLIASKDTFGKVIVGMTFMFGVLEFNGKYRLGYRPENHDFFDEDYHSRYRKMSLSDVIFKLKKGNTRLAKDLHWIDKLNIAGLEETGIPERRYIIIRIADRLTFARNPMLHGEAHNFYDKASYLVLIYILFHLHDQLDGTKYEGI